MNSKKIVKIHTLVLLGLWLSATSSLVAKASVENSTLASIEASSSRLNSSTAASTCNFQSSISQPDLASEIFQANFAPSLMMEAPVNIGTREIEQLLERIEFLEGMLNTKLGQRTVDETASSTQSRTEEIEKLLEEVGVLREVLSIKLEPPTIGKTSFSTRGAASSTRQSALSENQGMIRREQEDSYFTDGDEEKNIGRVFSEAARAYKEYPSIANLKVAKVAVDNLASVGHKWQRTTAGKCLWDAAKRAVRVAEAPSSSNNHVQDAIESASIAARCVREDFGTRFAERDQWCANVAQEIAEFCKIVKKFDDAQIEVNTAERKLREAESTNLPGAIRIAQANLNEANRILSFVRSAKPSII